ncbi:MAG: hypothetical protein R3C31_10870 [Hyphomonadaceae bacterium]
MTRFAFAAALTITCASPAYAETAYFTQLEDMPIAPGLVETTDHAEFSNDGVRMLSVSASGQAQAEQVRAYYDAALPALGWAISLGSGGENETVYLRGREQVSLSYYQRGEDLLLEVLLFSHAPPSD